MATTTAPTVPAGVSDQAVAREAVPPPSRKRAAPEESPQQRPFAVPAPAQHVYGLAPAAPQAPVAQQLHSGALLMQPPMSGGGGGGLYTLPHNYASGRLAPVQEQIQAQLAAAARWPSVQQQQPPQRQPGAPQPLPVASGGTYQELYARIPTSGGEAALISEFLRDELRSLLKANRVSYHKGGPQVPPQTPSKSSRYTRPLPAEA